jgi:cysteine-rich repeat protein
MKQKNMLAVLSIAVILGMSQVAHATPVCGDGNRQGSEQCDDGNNRSGDGCDATCHIETSSPGVSSRGSDISNLPYNPIPKNPLPMTLFHILPTQPPPQPPLREIICGDGKVEGAEQCDDGNANAGDGCSADCQVERSEFWHCVNSPNGKSACYQCGNGVIEPGEFCDSGDTSGCPAASLDLGGCQVTPGWGCGNVLNPDQTTSHSVCQPGPQLRD